MEIEVMQSFQTAEEFWLWLARNPDLRDQVKIRNSAEAANLAGIQSRFLGPVPAEEVIIAGPHYRESLVARGLTSRQRAVLDLLALEPKVGQHGMAAIYAPEAITPLAMTLRGRFPRFIGSEYTTSSHTRSLLYPILIEDLRNLSFPSEIYDAVITNDVLEHVPDIAPALSEIARILKPGAVMLSTFPFTWKAESLVRAKIVDGQIEHILEPEYHGNPCEPGQGSLVFTIPGWDILDYCREAGFSRVEMVFMASTAAGILGSESMALVNVLRAYR